MKEAGAGRYCDSCEKHIVDLTGKTDAELIHFFKKKKGNVCGRLLPAQLNRELLLPPSKVGWQWLLPMALGAIVSTPTQAKQLRPVVEQSNQEHLPVPISAERTIRSSVAADTIRGRVVDNPAGKPLKGVKLRQKGFENVLAITDSEGRFELRIPDGKLATAYTFDLDGYETVEMPLKDGMEVKMAIVIRTMVGGITAQSIHREPLYLIYAGKESCTIEASKMKEISADWIEKVEVLKDAKATALYGAKAANGVILIEIKKEYVKNIDFSKKK
jgi:TonB-dependent SusC/RagA subfamily outer membrane receptor